MAEIETEGLSEKINQGLIARYQSTNPSFKEQWSFLVEHFQKGRWKTLTHKHKLRLTKKLNSFVDKHIWYIPALETNSKINPWERVVVPGWNQTKEGRACIAYAKSGIPLSRTNTSHICPMCIKPFEQSTVLQPAASSLYCKGQFVYSYWLLHYMESHSVRPWDLDFIDAAMKWNSRLRMSVEWKGINLKMYRKILDLDLIFNERTMGL